MILAIRAHIDRNAVAGGGKPMCNLYNLTTNQQAIRDIAGATSDSLGNLEHSLDVYPDRPAPVVRNTGSGRELARLTWGMPTPPQFLKAPDAPDSGVTNIRNTASPHWRRWLGVAHRCVVPATAFSEYGQRPDPVTRRKPLHWFALDETQPLFFLAQVGDLHAVAGHTGLSEDAPHRRSPALRLPDVCAEQRGRADPSQGHAGDPDLGGRDRDLAGCRLVRSPPPAAPAGG